MRLLPGAAAAMVVLPPTTALRSWQPIWQLQKQVRLDDVQSNKDTEQYLLTGALRFVMKSLSLPALIHHPPSTQPTT